MIDETVIKSNPFADLAFSGKTGVFRWILTIIVSLFVGVILSIILGVVARMIFPDALKEGTLTYLALVLGVIAIYMPVFLIFAKIFHKRKMITFLTGYDRFRWKRLFTAALVFLSVIIIFEVISYIIKPATYHWYFDSEKFPFLMLITLLIVPFQAAAEEVLFRGYLQQFIVRLTKRPWIAIIISSVLFFGMHAMNPEFQKYGIFYALINYGGFGLLFGLLAFWDGGLEAAIGVHVINNMYGISLVSFNDSVGGVFSLIMIDPYDPLIGTISFVIGSVLFVMVLMKGKRSVFKERIFAASYQSVNNQSVNNQSVVK